jgi:energy-converting hydrogenase Eha subunit H
MLDNILKWTATLLLIVGTGVNSVNIYPGGALILAAGGTIWLIVSIRWREPALIATNAVMLVVGIVGLTIHFWV